MKRVQEKYKKQKLLGKGFYSKVYQVEEILTKKHYALKQIDISKNSNLVEIEILKKLKHPHILRIKEFF